MSAIAPAHKYMSMSASADGEWYANTAAAERDGEIWASHWLLQARSNLLLVMYTRCCYMTDKIEERERKGLKSNKEKEKQARSSPRRRKRKREMRIGRGLG